MLHCLAKQPGQIFSFQGVPSILAYWAETLVRARNIVDKYYNRAIVSNQVQFNPGGCG